jgi:hypothetical protein
MGIGDTVWSRRYHRNYDDNGMGIAIDGSANVAVTGFSFNSSDYDIVTIKYSNATGIEEESGVYKPTNSFILKTSYLIRKNLGINLAVNKSDWFDINLFDIAGKKVLPIYSGNLNIGEYNFNKTIPNSGVYFLEIKPRYNSENQSVCKKVISLR